ncbi:MAG: DUF1523 family protein, partial [Rubrimonas sp.]
MKKFKWIVATIIAVIFAGFLDYYLPSREVVRIVGTEVARMGDEVRDGDGRIVTRTRDVRFINAVRQGGQAVAFRNEDTGWAWPPYFKFDSADMAAQASNWASTETAPRWIVVTSYGWRIPFLSMFPNAVRLREATGPDETLFPWGNIVILATLALAVGLVARRV